MNRRIARIKDCAEVLSGFSAKGAIIDEPGGTVQVITAQHLSKGEPYRYREEDKLRISLPRVSGKYLLEFGDILFMSRGPKNYAVLLEEFPRPAIAPLTFFILRPKPNIIPAYLAWCLNQEPVKVQLNEIRTGAGTPMIPRQDFGEMTVPLPSTAMQKRIAAIGYLQSRETSLLRELMKETEHLQRLTGQTLLNRLTHDEKE